MAAAVLALVACGGKSAQQTHAHPGAGAGGAAAANGGAGGIEAGAAGGAADRACSELVDSGTQAYVQPPEGGDALLQLRAQPVPGAGGRHLRAVWAVAADDVYAAGDGVLHWDGCSWTVLREGEFSALWFDGSRLWLGGKSDDCADACSGSVLSLSGSRWGELPKPTGAVTSLWAAGQEEVWATILEPAPSPDLPPYPGVVRWDGAAWTRLRGGNAGGSYAVVGYDATQVFVGRPQGVERWDGAELKSAFSGSDCASGNGISGTALWLGGCRILNDELLEAGFRGRWGMSERDVWSVDVVGNISRFNGSGSVSVESGTQSALRAVGGAERDDVWVVGDSGTILHFAP